MTDIHDQAAVVVGGAKGIGQACVEALLNKGVKVSECYNTETR